MQGIAASPRQAAQRARLDALQPAPRGPVLQRAVGFEFQLPNTKLWRAEPRPTDPQPDDFLPYGEKVFEHSGLFHAESDEGELEFVTQAFEETPAGLQKLEQAVGGAANFATNILGFEVWPTSVSQVAKRYGAGTEVGEHTGPLSPRLGSRVDATGALDARHLLAKPQATMGVALGNIAALASKLIETYGQSEQTDATTREMKRSLDWAGSFVAEHGAARELAHKQAPPAVTNLATLIVQFMRHSRHASTCQERYHEEALEHHLPQEMQYGVGELAPLLYPKAEHTLMVRNSFKQMLSLLKSPDQTQVRELVDKLCKHEPELTANDLLYPHGYYSDAVKPVDYYTQSAEAHVLKGPTVGDWLGQVFGGLDDKADLPLPGTAPDRGMGALTKMDKSPRTGEHMPLFELRSFDGPLLPEQWLPLAQAVHQVVAALQGPNG